MTPDSGSHYNFEYKGVLIDPYRIMKQYQITHPAHQHALKKLLRAGRGHKELRQDITEVLDSLYRWLDMMEEDMETPPEAELVNEEELSEPQRKYRRALMDALGAYRNSLEETTGDGVLG